MKKIILIIYLFFTFTTNLYSLDCKGKSLISARYINFKQSDVIALCWVVEDKKLEIIKCFKGDLVNGENINFSTTLPMKKGEFWLIYSKVDKTNHSQLLIDECSISRNIKKPFLLKVIDYQPPSPTLYFNNRLLFNKKSESIKKQSFNDLSNEILWLDLQRNSVFLKEVLKVVNRDNRDNNNILIYILLFFILALQFIIIFIKHK